MKRLLFVVIVLVTFAIVNTPVSVFGYSVTEEQTVVENVGLNLLAEKEAILIAAVKEIDLFVLQIGSNGVVRRKESIELLKSVRQFERLKKKADGSLRFYGLTTKTDLAKGLRMGLFGSENTKGFFDHVMIIRDTQDTLKQYFVTQTKKDVFIQSFDMVTPSSVIFGISGIAFLCGALYIGKSNSFLTFLLLIVAMIFFLGLFI